MKRYRNAAIFFLVTAGIGLLILAYENCWLKDFDFGLIFPFWKKGGGKWLTDRNVSS